MHKLFSTTTLFQWGQIQKTYSKEYRNAVYLITIMSLLIFNIKSVTYTTIPLFILMTYSQPFLWDLKTEDKLTGLDFSIRKITLKNLLDDNCIITQFNAYKYIRDVLKAQLLEFKNMINDSINDFKVAFKLIEPADVVDSRLLELCKKWQHFFKFVKLTPLGSFENVKTEKEFSEAYEAAKKNRDPRIMFNKVRRLPITLEYTEESNLFTRLFMQNILVFYNFFKTTLVAVVAMFIYFLYTIFFFKIQFLKQLSVWFVIGMLYFWLMSGFNFFVKRYQYGKFTSQIQRFWKRTNTSFWLIEGFLILLFFYYYLNSSQEPLYMYDYSAINQEFLVSLQVVFVNIVLLSVVIYFMYFTMLRINSNSWTQLNVYLMLISVFVFFSFFIETYQFYYVISTFNERLWVFNEEENIWMIDVENPIMRTKHQYIFVCLIAKYWHFLFIFLSWVFFLIKSFERRKITYVLFGANLQNMVLLYVLNFACYIQWFKWLYRRFFDLPYTWFFTNIDNKMAFRIFFEMKLLILNLFHMNSEVYQLSGVVYKSLNSWGVDSLAMWKFI